MIVQKSLQGSIVALVTPMDERGDIQFSAIKNLVEWHISEGTQAIVASGTTGESATLSDTEQLQVIKTVVQAAGGRIPVIAGTGACSTQKAIERTKAAQDVGANACLIVTPYYNKPTQQGLLLHFTAIADSVDMPIILYNVPSRTGCDLLPETVIKLSQHPRIIGIKEATGKLERLAEIKQAVRSDFLCFSGDDPSCCEFMLQGGDGVISITSNVTPKLMQEMCKLSINNKINNINSEIALLKDKILQPLHHLMVIESNPIPVKYALQVMGKISAGIRLPLTTLSAAHMPVLERALMDLGL